MTRKTLKLLSREEARRALKKGKAVVGFLEEEGKWSMTSFSGASQKTPETLSDGVLKKAEAIINERVVKDVLYGKEGFDPVNRPKHYNMHPSGVECIQVTRHMNFNIGNAIKYLWRAGKKDAEIQDLKKAVWYIQDEIKRLEKVNNP